MKKRVFRVFLAVSFLCAFVGFATSVAPAATTITVDSSADDYLDGSSKTCLNSTPCTLRRAINQAYSAEKPVNINFNLSTGDANYDSATETWKITVTGNYGKEFRYLTGQVIIDGTSQPIGRTTGPKIIVNGRGVLGWAFKFYSNSNTVKGIATQQFKDSHIIVSSSGNTVQNCWLGLSDDGQSLSSGDIEVGEEAGGIFFSTSVSNNVVRGNKFAGFLTTACSINGTDNVFAGNTVGLLADGTVPFTGVHPCLSYHGDYVGGVGLAVSGTGNRIGGMVADRNYFAGLFANLSPTSTQEPAIRLGSTADDAIVKNNYIGITKDSKHVGVCGNGLDLNAAPDDVDILKNTISQPKLAAIAMNSGPQGVTIQENVIKKSTQWAADAIAYGVTGMDDLEAFTPAAVTKISVTDTGTTVQGTSGAGADCPGCQVEVFLDDGDAIKECTKFLKRVTANASGNWTAIFPTKLTSTQGVRTMSTVMDYALYPLQPGSTSNISQLYKVPVVTVKPSVAPAKEAGLVKGKFKFIRNSNWGNLVVNYTVTGTATAGTDYVALSGSVTIPAGSTFKEVVLTPKQDTKAEADETVIVTLTDKPHYNLGVPKIATIKIIDND